ncbi:PREDICTED: translation initiation factor IF-2-like [Rhinopithecus bieti]|uniref:translation initiation factor IF-2-like n=1 Tax=Rhinopithecus bieti TaxID=61621 RepID=UPI00083C4E45|nr:PREDICTED: translation initiation factor IF-2-like [Rhinopithecus bieti]XP_017730183.1 PREDICTED: translation initiation factor IF-2-like [Rhinopithecus bieti]
MGTGTQVQRQPELPPWGQGKGVHPEAAEAGAALPSPSVALSEGLPPPRAWGPGASAWGWRPWSRQAREDVAETEGGPGQLAQGKEQGSRPQGLALVTPPPMFLLAPFLLCEVNTQGNGAEGKGSPRPGLCSLGPGVRGGHGTRAALSYSPEGSRAMPPPCQPVSGPLGAPRSLPLTSAEPRRRLPALGRRLGARGPQGALKDCSSALPPLAARPRPLRSSRRAPCSLQPWAARPGGGGAALRGGRETKGGDREPRVRKPRAKTTTVGQRPATSFHDLWPPKPLCKVGSAPLILQMKILRAREAVDCLMSHDRWGGGRVCPQAIVLQAPGGVEFGSGPGGCPWVWME